MTEEVEQKQQNTEYLWNDGMHKVMFLWPESPQYPSEIHRNYAENERQATKFLISTIDRKIAKGIR